MGDDIWVDPGKAGQVKRMNLITLWTLFTNQEGETVSRANSLVIEEKYTKASGIRKQV